MYRCFIALFLLVFGISPVIADDHGVVLEELYAVHQTVNQFCNGISDRISSISGISKANTAVTAIGTVASGGALYAGIKKAKTDKKIEELSAKLCENGGCDPNKVEAMSDEEFFNTIMPVLVELIATGKEAEAADKLIGREQHKQEIEKSKRLGNWRTGLLAGTVATNIASAIMSGLNKDQSDLIQQISACNTSVQKLRESYHSAIQSGVNPLENPVMQTFQNTINKCGTLKEKDVEKIEKRMTAVMGTSIAGSVIGTVGVGTSAAANTDVVRNDNSQQGKEKEKTLNTISNVAAGANVATGVVETGLNISLITLTKELMKSAQQCEDTL